MVAKFVLTFLFCVAAISAVPAPVGDDISDGIKKAILAVLTNLGDPIVITNGTITIPANDYISGTLDVHTATITGFSGATMPSCVVEVLGLKISGELDLSTFGLVASAHQKTVTGADSYDDEVTIEFVLTKLDIKFSGAFDILTGHVKDVAVTATLGAADIKTLTGVLGSDEKSAELAKTLTANLATWVNADTKYFPILSTVIQNAINSYLDSNKAVAQKLSNTLVQPRISYY